jgi:putative DNA primase/helicase
MLITLNEIARRLNGSVSGRWINVRGPYHRAADRSLGIRFHPAAPDGFYIHSLAGDDEDECRAYVKSLIHKVNGGFSDICEPGHAPHANAAGRKNRAMALWQQGTSPTGTLLEPYLNSRRCTLEGILGSDVIRFHPDCPFGTLRVPAMLALITDAVTGEPIGVHRTAIKDDGSGKRFGADSKRALGIARSGAVRLHAASEHLGIAEGVESALSAAQVFGAAVWATLSSGGIARFPVLRGIKQLTVFADHDQPGMAAAATCCRRYNAAGIDAEIRYPIQPGTDWNDFVRQEQAGCQ